MANPTLNRLIALGGTYNKSPVQRYYAARDARQRTDMNKLAMKSQEQKNQAFPAANKLANAQTRQSMGINENKDKIERFEAFGKSIAPILAPIVEEKDPAKQEAMYQKAIPTLKQAATGYRIPIDMPPQFDADRAKTIVQHYAPEQYEEVKKGGVPVAQRNTKTNKLISHPQAKKDPDTIVQNYLGDQDELAKSLAKAYGADIIERRGKAMQAKDSLVSSNKAVDLLNSGVITGFGAEFLVGVGKAVRRMGFDVAKDDLSNTEAYYANQAKQVANIIQAFGAGTGLSDADREYAEKAAAGKITMTEDSLRKIIDINQRASKKAIEDFNMDVGKIPKGTSPVDLLIEVPTTKPVVQADAKTEHPTPETQEEYDAIQSGSIYIDPEDGKQYRKP